MPYDAISTNAAWSLLNRLTNTCSDDQHPQPGIASVIPSMNAPEEAVFLLISLANMATSRTKDDREFIEIAAKNILEVIIFICFLLFVIFSTNKMVCSELAGECVAV